MPFKYACFISYRNGQRQLMERIITDLSTALANELEAWLDLEVYVDRERLQGGVLYNEALAQALCESVCMIVIFTPTYFSKTHSYCAREYKAMEKLETARLHALGQQTDPKHGLIIPIVFRGAEALPDDIKERRHYYKFDDFLLSDVEISKHPAYAPKIREIARTIYDHHQRLSTLPTDLCQHCRQFTLPSEADILPWLETVQGSVTPFPGR